MSLIVAHEMNDADERVLELLNEGRNLPQNLANELNYSRQYVQNRLQMLKAAEYVDNLGGGLYEITPKGRAEINVKTQIDQACEDLERALKNKEWSAVKDAAAQLECEEL